MDTIVIVPVKQTDKQNLSDLVRGTTQESLRYTSGQSQILISKDIFLSFSQSVFLGLSLSNCQFVSNSPKCFNRRCKSVASTYRSDACSSTPPHYWISWCFYWIRENNSNINSHISCFFQRILTRALVFNVTVTSYRVSVITFF